MPAVDSDPVTDHELWTMAKWAGRAFEGSCDDALDDDLLRYVDEYGAGHTKVPGIARRSEWQRIKAGFLALLDRGSASTQRRT
jgi:hypothetical protein